MQWATRHTEGCPVTVARASLLADLERDPASPGLLGAVPEYDNGGDQEAELCTCEAVARCSHCSAVLTDPHPASRADGKLEGDCHDHGHVVAA